MNALLNYYSLDSSSNSSFHYWIHYFLQTVDTKLVTSTYCYYFIYCSSTDTMDSFADTALTWTIAAAIAEDRIIAKIVRMIDSFDSIYIIY
jgi:hypothetical protein